MSFMPYESDQLLNTRPRDLYHEAEVLGRLEGSERPSNPRSRKDSGWLTAIRKRFAWFSGGTDTEPCRMCETSALCFVPRSQPCP
jgi:hypothetical protein